MRGGSTIDPPMSTGNPDLFVICKSCGAEVSPYITECPYCGNRLRKRAPKLDREGRVTERRRLRRRPPTPSLPRLRRGEIPVYQIFRTTRLFDINSFHSVLNFLRRWTVAANRMRYNSANGKTNRRASVRTAPAPDRPARYRMKLQMMPV